MIDADGQRRTWSAGRRIKLAAVCVDGAEAFEQAGQWVARLRAESGGFCEVRGDEQAVKALLCLLAEDSL